MEGSRSGSSVEIEISSKDFISALAGEHHLHAHGFNLSRKEVHGRAGSNAGHIVCLQVVNHIMESIQTLSTNQ